MTLLDLPLSPMILPLILSRLLSLFPANSLRSRTSSEVSGSMSLSALCGENPLPTASTTFIALKGSPSSMDMLLTTISPLWLSTSRETWHISSRCFLVSPFFPMTAATLSRGTFTTCSKLKLMIDSTISSGAFS